MEVNSLGEAVKFMFLGMGVVYIFLIIMVYAIKIQTVLIYKFFPVKESEVLKKDQHQPLHNTQIKAAVIAAAVQHFAQDNNLSVTNISHVQEPSHGVGAALAPTTQTATPQTPASECSAPQGATQVGATVSGTIWKIVVKVGDKVQRGDVIAIIEAMKMEIDVEAMTDGTISSIAVTQNQTVEEGQTIAVIS